MILYKICTKWVQIVYNIYICGCTKCIQDTYKIRTKYIQNTSNLLFNLFSALWIFSNLLQWYQELRKPMIPESQLRRARAHSTSKKSLSEDELQEFEQANGGQVLEKSRRHEEIRECCSSSGEELSSLFTLEGIRSTLALASLACGELSKTGLSFDIWHIFDRSCINIIYIIIVYMTKLYIQHQTCCAYFA